MRIWKDIGTVTGIFIRFRSSFRRSFGAVPVHINIVFQEDMFSRPLHVIRKHIQNHFSHGFLQLFQSLRVILCFAQIDQKRIFWIQEILPPDMHRCGIAVPDLPDCPGRAVYVDWNRGEESWQDMILMSYCRSAVIANSTFSWWGAWLNPLGLKKYVVCPGKWYSVAAVGGRKVRETAKGQIEKPQATP